MSKELNDINLKLDSVRIELNRLSRSEVIKKYNKLKYEYHELQLQRNELYKKEKYQEFSSCNHIWICCGNKSKYCIKCGLNTIYKDNEYINFDLLNLEERIIYNYLLDLTDKEVLLKGVNFEYDMDNMIIYEKYQELKEKYPDKSDRIILKYLKESLDELKKENINLLVRKKED